MDIGGLPYWEVTFDAQGDPDPTARGALLDDIKQASVEDLIIFSHGWNNSQGHARDLYQTWLAMLPPLLPAARRGTVGLVGVIWPSMQWADEPIPNYPSGGAAAFDLVATPGEAVRALQAVYGSPDQQKILDDLANLLDSPPKDDAGVADGLRDFQQLMKDLAASESSDATAPEDAGPLAILEDPPRDVVERFMREVEVHRGASPDEGGAAGFSPVDIGRRLWSGAKEVFRQFTYWQMKRRAGTVGEHGLGPLLQDLKTQDDTLRVHLIGHSFGARLVSFSLRAVEQAASPVCSLTMLQGAFSHSAFAEHLPIDRDRAGALYGQDAKVHGPIVACFSVHDAAVGRMYPLASMAQGEDSAAFDDALQRRWGGMGHDGAQGVSASPLSIEPGDTKFSIEGPGFVNVDAEAVVKDGGFPSGAHSDIFHPELAGILAAAAALT